MHRFILSIHVRIHCSHGEKGAHYKQMCISVNRKLFNCMPRTISGMRKLPCSEPANNSWSALCSATTLVSPAASVVHGWCQPLPINPADQSNRTGESSPLCAQFLHARPVARGYDLLSKSDHELRRLSPPDSESAEARRGAQTSHHHQAARVPGSAAWLPSSKTRVWVQADRSCACISQILFY